MSISSALSNALSGLNVSSRAADLVSSNISNAMTEGYGVRELNVAARIAGGGGAGALVTGVTRHEDAALIGQRRQADAALGESTTGTEFLTRLEALIGTPEKPDSLSARSAAFEAALIAAANSPDNGFRLTAAAEAAVSLTGAINRVSDGIQAERLRADRDIAGAVTLLNDTLAQLSDLNASIRETGGGGGGDIASLLDAQSKLLNGIAPLVPLVTRRDGNGALQVYSQDGLSLLESRTAVFGFDPAASMQADLSLSAGTLSGLTLNGRDLPLTGRAAALAGGELAALFRIRDESGVAAQVQIDAVARDLATRFDAPGFDPTLAPGAPGLFTDVGSQVAAANEVGLAGRLRVNGAVLADQGGAAWRMRDGLGSVVQGPIGHTGFLQDQVDAMASLAPTVSGGFPAKDRSFTELLTTQVSQVGTARQRAEVAQSGASAQQASLLEVEQTQGVDTDAEMQRLLQIEKMFAANARVVSAAQDMIDELIRMT